MKRDAVDAAFLSLVVGEASWRQRALGALAASLESCLRASGLLSLSGGPW